MLHALLIAATLSSAPAASTAPESAAPEQPGDSDYAAALDRVSDAIAEANQDPVTGATALRDALSLLQLGYAARLAADPAGQRLRILAQLTLARARLASDDPEGAREAMDEAIRTSRGDPLPTDTLGPGLAALHREREAVLAKRGVGALVVDCRAPCRVFLNERPVPARVEALVPGDYRLWVEASDAAIPRLERVVEIAADATATVPFGPTATAPAIASPTPPPSSSAARARLLPRWADVLLVTAGAAAIGAGAALWAIDGRCPGGGDPSDTGACPQVYVTRTAGIVTLAAGAATLVAGTVTLSIDEVRTARGRARAASLVWTVQF